MDSMTSIAYNSGGGLFQIILNRFNLTNERFSFNQPRQHMKDQENYRPWFGHFGMTTNSLPNNIETYFYVILLFLKMYLLRCLSFCFHPLLNRALGLNFDSSKFFIAETISMLPFIIIPAVTSLLNFQFYNFLEKVNLFQQITILFICFIILFVSHIARSSKSSQK